LQGRGFGFGSLRRSLEVDHVTGGKLTEEWVELDMLGLLQQLGVIPPMG